MIEIIRNIVLVIYVIVCIVLIVLATIQARDTSGASQTVTGAAANNFYENNKGRTKEGRLKRATIISGVLFVVLAVVLSILFARAADKTLILTPSSSFDIVRRADMVAFHLSIPSASSDNPTAYFCGKEKNSAAISERLTVLIAADTIDIHARLILECPNTLFASGLWIIGTRSGYGASLSMSLGFSPLV